MSLCFSLESFELFNVNLLKCHHQGKAAFNYLLSSKTLIKNSVVCEQLQLHSCFRFGECYSLLMKNTNPSTKAFYSKLASYLLSLEEISIKATIGSLANDYLTSIRTMIDFHNSKHRKVLIDYFNIKQTNDVLGVNLNEEMLYINIINLLEYYGIINERTDNLSDAFNDFFCSISNQLGNSFEDKNKKCFIDNIKAFLNSNQLSIQSCDIQKVNKYQSSSKIENKYNMRKEEDKAFDDKLNYIYESLKDITFDSNTHSVMNDIAINENVQQEESKLQSLSQSNDYNHVFLKRLKIFSILKKNVQKRKANKQYYQKKTKILSMAKYFYWNLLKSRTFFGFAKLMKLKVYFNIIKNNYIDFRIGELAHKLFNVLAYSCNRSKLVKCEEQRHNKRLKRKVINYLKEKAHYKISFNQYYVSQILNNQYALKFMLPICSIAQSKMYFKPAFKAIYNKMQKTDSLNEKRRLFNLTLDSLKKNKRIYDDSLMKYREIEFVIDYHCFIAKIKKLMHVKNLQRHFMQKLFLMRYYVKYYQRQHDLKVVKDKERQVLGFIIKGAYYRFRHRIGAKVNQKTRINQIMTKVDSKSSTIQFQKQKANEDIKYTINTPKALNENENNRITLQPKISLNKDNSNLFYCKKLKQRLWRILKHFHKLQQNIIEFRENSTKKSISLFFKLMQIKVIKVLINQGIVEKIKQYQRVLLLQVLFSSYFAKLKYSKGKRIRIKYLCKTVLGLLSKNVKQNYKLIQLKMKYYIRLFNKKALYNISTKENHIQNNQALIRLMHNRIFIKVVAYKIHLKKQRHQLVNELLNKNKIKSIKRFILCKRKIKGVNKNKDQRNRKLYSKSLLNKIKRAIDMKEKYFKLKVYQRKSALSVFNKNVHCNIVNNTLNFIKYNFIIQKSFHQFKRTIDTKGELTNNRRQLQLIAQKFYGEYLINSIIVSSRLKSINYSVYQIYQNKIKEKIFQTYKKRYINKIKFSMFSMRYREYLIITSYTNLIKKKNNNQMINK